VNHEVLLNALQVGCDSRCLLQGAHKSKLKRMCAVHREILSLALAWTYVIRNRCHRTIRYCLSPTVLFCRTSRPRLWRLVCAWASRLWTI